MPPSVRRMDIQSLPGWHEQCPRADRWRDLWPSCFSKTHRFQASHFIPGHLATAPAAEAPTALTCRPHPAAQQQVSQGHQ